MNEQKPSARLAKLLDYQFTIPGTNWRFGLDPLLGLLPGVGDGISFIFQAYLVYLLSQKGYSGKLVAKMLINIILDTLIGSIPVIGQLWDFWFKASKRNLQLAEEHWYENKHEGSGAAWWIGMLIFLIGTIVAIIWLIVELVQWIISLF